MLGISQLVILRKGDLSFSGEFESGLFAAVVKFNLRLISS